jgi:hypothetical protein
MARLVFAFLLISGVAISNASSQDKKDDGRTDPPILVPKTGGPATKGAKTAAIPGEVDIHFLNGSTVRMVVQTEKIEVATAYGKLVIPVKDLRAIEFGLHFPEGVEAKIEGAIKELGSGDYRTRERASAALIDLGPFSYPAVLEATRIKDLETSQRAKELAKKLVANHPKKDLKTTADDKVFTRNFTIVGRILTTSIKSKTEYFGDLELTLAKMRTLRSVGGVGLDMEFAVDASKYANQGQWMDTGYKVDGRTTINITAKGMIDVWPQQGGGYMSSPNGLQATQRGNAAGINFGGRKVPAVNLQQHCGMLLGKIGEDGEIFIVGERYDGMPETEGTLFLHIGPSQWNAQSAGQFDVKVARKD